MTAKTKFRKWVEEKSLETCKQYFHDPKLKEWKKILFIGLVHPDLPCSKIGWSSWDKGLDETAKLRELISTTFGISLKEVEKAQLFQLHSINKKKGRRSIRVLN